MKSKYFALVCCLTLFQAGCATIEEGGDPERLEQVTGIDKHSTYPAARRESFEKLNLLELIDPEGNAKLAFPETWKVTYFKDEAEEKKKRQAMSQKYDLSLAYFRQRADIPDEEKRKRRNSIQERILSVSLSRCNVFKTYLRRDQADKNFLLGSATTVAAVLGAVLPGAETAKHMAGAAGIFSGIRSEYNEAYYANLAAHVIAKGIEVRQETAYKRIRDEGQSKRMSDYPLEAAIKDAVYFDGLCSVVAGLDQASASVDATHEPGVEAAMRTVLRAKLLKHAAEAKAEDLVKPEFMKSLNFASQELGMSLLGATGKAVSAIEDVDLTVAASLMKSHILESVAMGAGRVELAAQEKKLGLLKASDTSNDENTEPKAGVFLTKTSSKLDEYAKALALDTCYTVIAADAVQKKIDALKQRSEAGSDGVAVAIANLKLSETEKGVANAHETLATKEKIVLHEVAVYVGGLISKIIALDESKEKALASLAALKGFEFSLVPETKSPVCKSKK